MVNIEPMNIKRQTFKKSFKGYDVDEVSHFLEMIGDQFDDVLKERDKYQSKAEALERDVHKYEKLEKTIQDTLISSQKTLDDSRLNSEQEAKIIIKEAEIKAQEISNEINAEKSALNNDLLQLAEQKKTFVIRFRSLIKSQLEIINVLEAEPTPEFHTSKHIENIKTKIDEVEIPKFNEPTDLIDENSNNDSIMNRVDIDDSELEDIDENEKIADKNFSATIN